GDTYEPEMGHVIPALIDRFHRATQRGDPEVVVWGSGEPLREFLHCDDLADACVHLLGLTDAGFDALLGDRRLDAPSFAPPLVNIGSGQEIRIADLAGRIAAVVGYGGRIVQDRSRPDGTPRKLLDSSRLRATGWSPSIGLEEGLQRAWADYRARHCAAG
ncbi:MAG: NAD-dependent epimerase/dehydratase family protein, partial [Rubrivivax sp.]|nr:NAD-dependent epimerase/dehydratase family protein [Rubrivivax sp.]